MRRRNSRLGLIDLWCRHGKWTIKVVARVCCPAAQHLFQYTAIDEFSRLRYLAAYEEQSTYSSAKFLKKAYAFFKRHGFTVECVQTDNGFEFTNRFAKSNRELITLFEKTAAELGIRHKQIRPYTFDKPTGCIKLQSVKKVAERHYFEFSQVLPLALAPGRQNPQGTKT